MDLISNLLLAGGSFIVQVTPSSVILLLESEMVQTLPVDLGSPIGTLSILPSMVFANDIYFIPKEIRRNGFFQT